MGKNPKQSIYESRISTWSWRSSICFIKVSEEEEEEEDDGEELIADAVESLFTPNIISWNEVQTS